MRIFCKNNCLTCCRGCLTLLRVFWAVAIPVIIDEGVKITILQGLNYLKYIEIKRNKY